MLGSRPFLKLTFVFAAIHGALLLFSFMTAFGRGMYRFDHPEAPESLLERACSVATLVLIQPYGVLIGKIGLHVPFLDLTAVLLNSLLWGAACSLLFLLVSMRKSLIEKTYGSVHTIPFGC